MRPAMMTRHLAAPALAALLLLAASPALDAQTPTESPCIQQQDFCDPQDDKCCPGFECVKNFKGNYKCKKAQAKPLSLIHI